MLIIIDKREWANGEVIDIIDPYDDRAGGPVEANSNSNSSDFILDREPPF